MAVSHGCGRFLLVSHLVHAIVTLFSFQRDPAGVILKLNRLGVDAYRGASQLDVLSHNCGSEGVKTPVADALMRGVVYLPVHKNVPLADLSKICDRVALVLTDLAVSTTADNDSLKSKL